MRKRNGKMWFSRGGTIVVIDDNSTANLDSLDDYCQVVETSVTVNNSSPIQDYVHPNNHTQPTYEN